MRKPIKVLLFLFVGVVGLLVWFALSPGEPSYNGRSLSSWFKQYYSSGQFAAWDPGLNAEASTALNVIGSNALPFLLEQAFSTEQDSAFRKNLGPEFSRSLPNWCPKFWSHDTMREEAMQAILGIKPPASLLLPQLEKPLSEANVTNRLRAIFLLGALGEGGEAGVPRLLQALDDDNPRSRILALQSLKWLGPKAGAAVPRLTELLQAEESRSNHLYQGIAYALGAIGSNAAPAIPALKKLFNTETNQDARTAMAMGLCQIDGRQEEALAFLVGLLKSPTSTKQELAARYLGQLGPNASVAISALLDAIDSDRIVVSMAAVDALKKMGVSNEVLLPKLESNLQSSDETIRVNSAARILDMDPANSKAQQALLRLVQSGSMFASFAVETLGRAGAAAKPVIPALHQTLPTASKQLREQTLRALKQIESDVSHR
jgi:HEAT repeat protein